MGRGRISVQEPLKREKSAFWMAMQRESCFLPRHYLRTARDLQKKGENIAQRNFGQKRAQRKKQKHLSIVPASGEKSLCKRTALLVKRREDDADP